MLNQYTSEQCMTHISSEERENVREMRYGLNMCWKDHADDISGDEIQSWRLMRAAGPPSFATSRRSTVVCCTRSSNGAFEDLPRETKNRHKQCPQAGQMLRGQNSPSIAEFNSSAT